MYVVKNNFKKLKYYYFSIFSNKNTLKINSYRDTKHPQIINYVFVSHLKIFNRS